MTSRRTRTSVRCEALKEWPALAGGRRGAAVAVEAGGVVPAAAPAGAPAPARAADGGAEVGGVEAAVAGPRVELELPRRPSRDDVDDAGDRVGAVQRAARPLDDLDLGDVLGREAREVDDAADPARRSLAVDRGSSTYLASRPCHLDPDPAGTREAAQDLEAGLLLEDARQALRTRGLDRGAVDHPRRDRDVADRLLGPRRGHHHRLGLLRRPHVRPRARRGGGPRLVAEVAVVAVGSMARSSGADGM